MIWRRGTARGEEHDVGVLSLPLGVVSFTERFGGDRLAVWTYPEEADVVYQEGGWNADDIAIQFEGRLGQAMQPYGIQMPKDPVAGNE